jgi:hypothetical protein
MWVLSLALAAAIWASRHGALSSPSVGQVIADLESEPASKRSPLNQGDRT